MQPKQPYALGVGSPGSQPDLRTGVALFDSAVSDLSAGSPGLVPAPTGRALRSARPGPEVGVAGRSSRGACHPSARERDGLVRREQPRAARQDHRRGRYPRRCPCGCSFGVDRRLVGLASFESVGSGYAALLASLAGFGPPRVGRRGGDGQLRRWSGPLSRGGRCGQVGSRSTAPTARTAAAKVKPIR